MIATYFWKFLECATAYYIVCIFGEIAISYCLSGAGVYNSISVQGLFVGTIPRDYNCLLFP